MADTTELIHAGLPWNNPQKITVKADEYISQLVINRGLLNLLSNDYYLDLKTERINQYIVQQFGPHMNDMTIHWTSEALQDFIRRFLNGELNALNGLGLLKDTAYIIPLIANEEFPKNVNRIQNIINNCPKNLNGHAAIFAITPVVDGDYNHTIGEYYRYNKQKITGSTYDIDNDVSLINCYTEPTKIDTYSKCIALDNFYGGTIVLMGNDFFTCEEKYKNGGKDLNTRQTRILLEQIQKNLDKPLNQHITIAGDGENNNCAVVSFNNCNCDSYIWNLNIKLNIDTNTASPTTTSNSTTTEDSIKIPFKRDLAWNFPCNLKDDAFTGNIRYIVADVLNNQNFTETYVTMRAQDQTIISGTDNNYYDSDKLISSICLNGDYFELDASYKNFSQTFFGKYIEQEDQQIDNIYNGASLCFWMKQNFYGKNVSEVPIIYSVDPNKNGYYIGLEKVASIVEGQIDNSQYLETTFASKKKNDLSNDWMFWTITIEPENGYEGLTNNQYRIKISYTNPKTLVTNFILPNKLITNVMSNVIKLPYLNLLYPMYFFGTPEVRSEANIRNILLFNKVLEQNEINGLASEELADIYNLSPVDLSQTFKNGMKGALYVYNTTSMNIIGCNLIKEEV